MTQRKRIPVFASSQNSNSQTSTWQLCNFFPCCNAPVQRHPWHCLSPFPARLPLHFLPLLFTGRSRKKGISFHYQWQEKWSDPPFILYKPKCPKVSASHPSGTGIQLWPALAPTAEAVVYSPLPCMPSHCFHYNPSQTLYCHFSAWKGGLADVLPDFSLLIQNTNVSY